MAPEAFGTRPTPRKTPAGAAAAPGPGPLRSRETSAAPALHRRRDRNAYYPLGMRGPAASRPRRPCRTPRRSPDTTRTPSACASCRSRTSLGANRTGAPCPRRVDERQPGHRGPLGAEIDLRHAQRRRIGLERRVADQQGRRRSRAPSRRGQDRAARTPARLGTGGDTSTRINVTDVRELVSSAMCLISLNGPPREERDRCHGATRADADAGNEPILLGAQVFDRRDQTEIDFAVVEQRARTPPAGRIAPASDRGARSSAHVNGRALR